MRKDSTTQEQEIELAEALRSLWEQAHGTPPGDVRVLVGAGSVSAWLREILNPAEQAAAAHAESQTLLQRYAEELLSTIQPDLRARVEDITGSQILSDTVHADVVTGHMLCFFVLDERRPDGSMKTKDEPRKSV